MLHSSASKNIPESGTEEVLAQLTHTLSALRISPVGSEYHLHNQISAALQSGGFVVAHEVPLAPRCRIDFLVNGVGIEVKRGKVQRSTLLSQCRRYLQSDRLQALLVVLDTSVNLPREVDGKPLRVFGLNRLWGIALP